MIRNSRLEGEILHYVRKGNDLPIAPGTFTMLAELTSSLETSVTDLANIILKDYGLTSKILKLVNSVHFMRFGQVTTISRAIILLGIENIKNIVITMSLVEKLQKSRSSYLPGLLSKAIFAALLGEQIAVRMKYPDKEEPFLCSLFYFLGEILTSYYAPKKYAEIREMLDRETDTSPEGLIFATGNLYREIGRKVAQQWGFPGKVVFCMKKLEKPQANSKSDLDWLHCISSIANAIADITEKEAEESVKKEQIEALFGYFGEQYQTILENIATIINTSAENLNRYCAAYGIDFRETPIGEGLPETTEQEPVAVPEEFIEELHSDFLAGMMTTETVTEETQDPEVIFANGMRDIARALLDNYEMEDIFTIIMETVYRGLRPAGLKRALLMIRNTRAPVLDVRLAMGDSTMSLRKWFIPSLTGTEDDIFNIAVGRQKDLLIKDSESVSAKKLLPEWLSSRLKAPVFLMVLPIIIKSKTIGIIYLEGEREGLAKILPTHFYYVKILHDQSVLAIKKKSGI